MVVVGSHPDSSRVYISGTVNIAKPNIENWELIISSFRLANEARGDYGISSFVVTLHDMLSLPTFRRVRTNISNIARTEAFLYIAGFWVVISKK
jgi:hypothetical protein